MNDINKLLEKLNVVAQKARIYLTLAVIIMILGTYGFLVFRIGQLVQTEPSEDSVAEQLQTTKRPKLDQDSINKLEQLKDQNVQVETLFEQARNNPFQD